MSGEDQAREAEEIFGADASDDAPAPGSDGAAEDELFLSDILEEEAEAVDGEVELIELDKAVAERDEYLDALRRLQAEFDNYRKRTVRQQSEALGHAAESLIERFLPVLDALDLAIAHGDEPEAGAGALLQALQQINALARDILAREGLERIDAAGVAFDPTVHDAVAHLPESDEDEAEPGVVVGEVLRAGYQLKGRVLRPAMVSVRG